MMSGNNAATGGQPEPLTNWERGYGHGKLRLWNWDGDMG
jgi:hypothetical protein